MRRAAIWCLRPKGRAGVTLCPLSQAGMPGTPSHPTVRAAAASAVQSMQQGAVAVAALLAPAAPSAPATPQNWLVLHTQCPTNKSTASWSRPTSRASRAGVISETHDDLRSPDRGPVSEPHMLVHLTQLFPPISSYCEISQLSRSVDGGQLLVRYLEGFIIQKNQNDNRFSNNNCVISISLFCDPLGVWPVWFTCCSQSHFVTEWLLMTMMNPCVFVLNV